MKIVLIKDVKNIGKAGIEIEVSDGYAINYLIPKGIAIEAVSNEGIKKKRRSLEHEEKILNKNEEVKSSIENLPESIDVAAEVNEEGHTFGSVNSNTINEKLKELGFSIDIKNITFKPQKSIGESDAVISFQGLKKSIKVNVIKK